MPPDILVNKIQKNCCLNFSWDAIYKVVSAMALHELSVKDHYVYQCMITCMGVFAVHVYVCTRACTLSDGVLSVFPFHHTSSCCMITSTVFYLSTCSTWKLFQRCLMSVLNIDLWKCYITYVRQTKASLNTYRCVCDYEVDGCYHGDAHVWPLTLLHCYYTQRENASDLRVCFRPCGHWLSLGLDMAGVHCLS